MLRQENYNVQVRKVQNQGRTRALKHRFHDRVCRKRAATAFVVLCSVVGDVNVVGSSTLTQQINFALKYNYHDMVNS